jgi:hypothetical protein
MLNPNNRAFAWLGVLSAATGIIGFLMQIGAAPVLTPLTAVVSIPVWLLICVFLALPWVLSSAVKHSSTAQLRKIDDAQARIAELEVDRASLKAEANAISIISAEAASGKVAVARLLEYERLENEIIGELKGGERLSISELGFRTSAGPTLEGKQKFSRAIASLGKQISGSDGRYQFVGRGDA